LRKAVPEEVPEPDNGPDVLDEGGFADILEAMLVSEAPQYDGLNNLMFQEHSLTSIYLPRKGHTFTTPRIQHA
jgi:hypothetical protein